MSLFEQLGGEPKLRAIVDDFVDRCFDDMMIGFLFTRAERNRIKRFEYEHAAKTPGRPDRVQRSSRSAKPTVLTVSSAGSSIGAGKS